MGFGFGAVSEGVYTDSGYAKVFVRQVLGFIRQAKTMPNALLAQIDQQIEEMMVASEAAVHS